MTNPCPYHISKPWSLPIRQFLQVILSFFSISSLSSAPSVVNFKLALKPSTVAKGHSWLDEVKVYPSVPFVQQHGHNGGGDDDDDDDDDDHHHHHHHHRHDKPGKLCPYSGSVYFVFHTALRMGLSLKLRNAMPGATMICCFSPLGLLPAVLKSKQSFGRPFRGAMRRVWTTQNSEERGLAVDCSTTPGSTLGGGGGTTLALLGVAVIETSQAQHFLFIKQAYKGSRQVRGWHVQSMFEVVSLHTLWCWKSQAQPASYWQGCRKTSLERHESIRMHIW